MMKFPSRPIRQCNSPTFFFFFFFFLPDITWWFRCFVEPSCSCRLSERVCQVKLSPGWITWLRRVPSKSDDWQAQWQSKMDWKGLRVCTSTKNRRWSLWGSQGFFDMRWRRREFPHISTTHIQPSIWRRTPAASGPFDNLRNRYCRPSQLIGRGRR